jgi:hypothetical protein
MKLNEKAMLVSLNIGEWSPYKADLTATQVTLRTYGAKNGCGKFNKRLVEHEAVKQYRRAMGDARTFHYANTLPWGDDGARILPSENYMAYMKKMREFQTTWENAVGGFVEEYPYLIERAQRDLSGLFNSQDYPTQRQIRAKFHFSTHISPLPDQGDFRVDLGTDEVSAIQADIEARVQAQVKESVNDLWGRLHKAIGHVVERLKGSDKIFRDSLVANIKELTDVLPRLNITGDAALARTIEEARAALADLDPQELRENEAERKVAADKADDILKRMAAYMGA